jgi:transcriptional regulator with XRE-family HTH domain
MDELADRAGIHETYIGLLERRARQPTLAAAASLAEALGLRLSELVAEAEQDAGNGFVPVMELLPSPPRRHVDGAHLGDCARLEALTGLTAAMIARAVELAYRKLDIIDEQMRESGSRPLVGIVDLAELSSVVEKVLGAGLARASNGLYALNGPDRSPRLLPLHPGLPELEVKAALETGQPAGSAGTTRAHLMFRYVLAGRDGTFARGKDSRGETVAVWEIRFGELEEADFHSTSKLRKDAFDAMELLYYDPALLPYAKPTGVYAAGA